jgi:hypothetical protein
MPAGPRDWERIAHLSDGDTHVLWPFSRPLGFSPAYHGLARLGSDHDGASGFRPSRVAPRDPHQCRIVGSTRWTVNCVACVAAELAISSYQPNTKKCRMRRAAKQR